MDNSMANPSFDQMGRPFARPIWPSLVIVGLPRADIMAAHSTFARCACFNQSLHMDTVLRSFFVVNSYPQADPGNSYGYPRRAGAVGVDLSLLKTTNALGIISIKVSSRLDLSFLDH